jgi:hypothetical protein
VVTMWAQTTTHPVFLCTQQTQRPKRAIFKHNLLLQA